MRITKDLLTGRSGRGTLWTYPSAKEEEKVNSALLRKNTPRTSPRINPRVGRCPWGGRGEVRGEVIVTKKMFFMGEVVRRSWGGRGEVMGRSWEGRGVVRGSHLSNVKYLPTRGVFRGVFFLKSVIEF